MDNPWATTWDDNPSQWPTALNAEHAWEDVTTVHLPDTAMDDDIAPQDQLATSHLPVDAAEPHSASVSDHQPVRPISPLCGSSDPVSETNDAILHNNMASVSSLSVNDDVQTTLDPPDHDWSTAWATASPSDTNPKQTQHLDQWEAARQEKEKLNRVVPPELLDSILRHCQKVVQEIWPTPGTNDEDNWRSGFDGHADISALLAQLIPTDSALPPAVQFSATATAKAMNEALKLTRHSSVSATSPLSRLLASKGSLEWEKSMKAKQDVVPDTAHVGWRVLEKEDRISTLAEESKSKKATGGLLSFWSRRTSAIQAAPVEAPRERSSSPARSSLESVKSTLHPPSSRAASPSKATTASVPPPPSTDPHPAVVATASAPSAVSRFLNRFSRVKGAQHTSLALSSDDLEFLSDIVPSASDPPESINDSALDASTGASPLSPLPPKLPPPIQPPPKQPLASSRPSSALGLATVAGVSMTGSAPTDFQVQAANHIPNVPLLVTPLSPRPAASLSRAQSPLSLTDVTVASGQSSTSSIQQRLQSSSQSNSRPHSFTLPPPQKIHPSLHIPPLLPPPPVSPPQTPRPTAFPSGHSSTMRSTNASSFHDSNDSDDEFSAFASFPPSAAPFLPSEPYPSQGPPSLPPRRTYERKHYPSSSSTSSILSPASQSSLDQLYSTKSFVSASLDSFDDFVSPPPAVRDERNKRTPSPPPLPVKPLQHYQPPRLDTVAPRVYHAHTPSQMSTSPTVHTSLMHSAFSVPTEEHRRTQTLVNRAAARGGIMWPAASGSDEPRVRTIPPPPSSSSSPKPLIGEEGLDLLGDGDALGGGLRLLPAPLSAVGGSVVSPVDAPRTPFGVAGGPGKGLDLRNQLQPSPPPLPSTSTPIFSFSSLGKPTPLAAANPGSLQPAKPKQTGGLSAQDLSFFEGL
ncbi:hypothetical protein V8E55_005612 [Tylopilus felleus]